MSYRNDNHSDFYQAHLDRVSRSFAFCIRQLREPLRSRVALAYLLCRVLDTVEDTPYADCRLKFAQIEEFNAFMTAEPSDARVRRWAEEIPGPLAPGERELIEDADILFADFHQLPQKEKRILRDATLSMSYGMSYFLRRSGGSHLLELSSIAEVNRYCFFVAGVVGEMLSRLLECASPNFELDSEKLLRAHQFGLFLQKINILKDQLDDEKVGRRLVPSQEELWKSLEADLQGAMEYLLALPLEEREYRLFCGWSLFLGLASVPWIRSSWARKVMNKIPRAATEQILAEVTARIDDNRKLRDLFETMKPEFERGGERAEADDDGFPDFEQLYLGSVSREHLSKLGMLEGSFAQA